MNKTTINTLLTITILMFVTYAIISYSYHIQLYKADQSKMMVDISGLKLGSGAENFIYSVENVSKTLLGIRDKNCHALNEYPNYASSFCQDLQRCNLARSEVPDLPEGCQRRLPKCIIIGVAKSGTRELTDFLSMHPNIAIKDGKTYLVQYYTKNWDKGSEWHRGKMPFSLENQITLYKSKYFFPNAVPARIKMSDPNMKLILIVRDPVERAISFYTFRFPDRPLSDLTKMAENGTLNGQFYDEAFERYLQHFSRSQIHVIDSDKFQKDPHKVLSKLETFLGLTHVISKEDFVFNKNKGFFCLRDVSNTFSSCFGDDRGRKKIQDETVLAKELLRPRFKVHNERFFNMTGQRFKWL